MKNILIEVIKLLEKRGESISFAESCTGGRVASAFTSIAGVSSVFNGSCVTYSNEIKHLWLGVKEDTLRDFGAVSSECVYEMLSGIRQKADSDHAIAISGIAGPDGGTPSKPVGTVYIGVLIRDRYIVNRYHFNGDREAVQKAATETAIELFAENLKNL